mmetsp:Transcript_30762/g.30247  ORF Transcript_30762/g.30247 Transcript_30762/m.30247 type:complete len:201 (-) Transcript_30762:268-870(-)
MGAHVPVKLLDGCVGRSLIELVGSFLLTVGPYRRNLLHLLLIHPLALLLLTQVALRQVVLTLLMTFPPFVDVAFLTDIMIALEGRAVIFLVVRDIVEASLALLAVINVIFLFLGEFFYSMVYLFWRALEERRDFNVEEGLLELRTVGPAVATTVLDGILQEAHLIQVQVLEADLVQVNLASLLHYQFFLSLQNIIPLLPL